MRQVREAHGREVGPVDTVLGRARATRPPSRRCATPASRIRASSACSSEASGVVCSSDSDSPSMRAPVVPISPTRCPAARAIASSRYVVVVLPFVPVTPRHAQRRRRIAVEPCRDRSECGPDARHLGLGDGQRRAVARRAGPRRPHRPRPRRGRGRRHARRRCTRSSAPAPDPAAVVRHRSHVDVRVAEEIAAPRPRRGAPAAARARSSPSWRDPSGGGTRQGTGPRWLRWHGRRSARPGSRARRDPLDCQGVLHDPGERRRRRPGRRWRSPEARRARRSPRGGATRPGRSRRTTVTYRYGGVLVRGLARGAGLARRRGSPGICGLGAGAVGHHRLEHRAHRRAVCDDTTCGRVAGRAARRADCRRRRWSPRRGVARGPRRRSRASGTRRASASRSPRCRCRSASRRGWCRCTGRSGSRMPGRLAGEVEPGRAARTRSCAARRRSAPGPASRAIRIVPTFDDCRTMSATVSAVGCVSHVLVLLAVDVDRLPGTESSVLGFTRPASSAAAIVTTLLVEPGSNTSVTGRFGAAPTGAGCAGCVGGRAVDGRHREHVAGVHVRRRSTVPPLAVVCVDLVGEDPLDLVLERLVDREHEVGAALRGASAALAFGQVASPSGRARPSSRPGARRASPRARPRARRARRCRRRRSRAAARRARRPGSSASLSGTNPMPARPSVRTVVGDVVARPGGRRRRTRAASGSRRAVELELVDADDRRELGRVRRRVRDHARVGPDASERPTRHREVVAVAVEDAAALGRRARPC